MQNNIMATSRVLEAMRLHKVPELVFTSTSTVYGDAKVIPTPEDMPPPADFRLWSEQACLRGVDLLVLLFIWHEVINIPDYKYRGRSQRPRRYHGFYPETRSKPGQLEILGDGKQAKSYLEVHECVAAMLFALRARETVNIFNIGSEDWIDVKSIAEIVVEEMHLPDVKFQFTGGERGWVGDVQDAVIH